MSDLQNHLSSADIRALLEVEPSDDSIRGVQEHLDHCRACQDRLSRQAADPWWFNDGQDLFSSAVLSSADQDDQDFVLVGNGSESKSNVFDLQSAQVAAIVKELEPAVHPELLGQIDGLQVEKLIGVGGMGIVFKAFNPELNRPVAIKFLLPSLAKSGVARQRFAQEAKAVAAVCHENVIPIFRINTSCLYPFFVMPHVGGKSLEALVHDEGSLDVVRIVQIAHQIADGLSAAHSLGQIHRDIKPGNILLTNDCNRVVITDFGLVRNMEQQDCTLTRPGEIAGTPVYMSPEQALCQKLDARTDLYSLGGVMYWLATGQAPVSGASQLEVLNNLQNGPVTGPRSINAAIPVELESVILKLLEKKPDNRFSSAAELASYLHQYSAHLSNPADHRLPRLKHPARRHWRRILAVAAAGSAAAAIWICSQMTGANSSDLRSSNEVFGHAKQRQIEFISQIVPIASIPDHVVAAAESQFEGCELIRAKLQIGPQHDVHYVFEGRSNLSGGPREITVDAEGNPLEYQIFTESVDDSVPGFEDERTVCRVELMQVPDKVVSGAASMIKGIVFTDARLEIHGRSILYQLEGVADGLAYQITSDSDGECSKIEFLGNGH